MEHMGYTTTVGAPRGRDDAMAVIDRIREKIRSRDYYLSSHAEEETAKMTCEFCNSQTHRKKVRKQHWYQGKLYIVENVDAEVCDECGERYFHATTLDAIDRLIAGDHTVKEVLSVEVLSAKTD